MVKEKEVKELTVSFSPKLCDLNLVSTFLLMKHFDTLCNSVTQSINDTLASGVVQNPFNMPLLKKPTSCNSFDQQWTF